MVLKFQFNLFTRKMLMSRFRVVLLSLKAKIKEKIKSKANEKAKKFACIIFEDLNLATAWTRE